MGIGKLERVPLRELWKHEEKDLTPWLADNLQVLGDVLGISLSLVETEKSVGSFSCDLLAEDGHGDYVVIECQFSKTDHGHLGKVLTYLTGLNAKTAIWICETCSPEHETAIDWLNESSAADTAFYVLSLEAVRIGDSDAAPMFKVVCAPSDERKEMGKKKEALADRHEKRIEFWGQLLEKSKSKTKLFSNVSPSKENWIAAGSGKGGATYNYQILMHESYVFLYIDKGKGHDEINKKRFSELYLNKAGIEQVFGGTVKWTSEEGRRSTLISAKVTDVGLKDEEEWPHIQDQMVDAMVRFEKALKPFIEKLS